MPHENGIMAGDDVAVAPIIMRCQAIVAIPDANLMTVCNLPTLEAVTFTPKDGSHPPMSVPLCPAHQRVMQEKPQQPDKPLIQTVPALPTRRRFGS